MDTEYFQKFLRVHTHNTYNLEELLQSLPNTHIISVDIYIKKTAKNLLEHLKRKLEIEQPNLTEQSIGDYTILGFYDDENLEKSLENTNLAVIYEGDKIYIIPNTVSEKLISEVRQDLRL